MKYIYLLLSTLGLFSFSCTKNNPGTDTKENFIIKTIQVDSLKSQTVFNNINYNPYIKITFNKNISTSTLTGNITLKDDQGKSYPFTLLFENNDSSLIIQLTNKLGALTKIYCTIYPQIKSVDNTNLNTSYSFQFVTKFDNTPKFPTITDDSLLTLVQKQTFKYFWDFGHPTSGLSRERNTSGNTCTTGGTGFGIQSIIVGIKRNFITRQQGLERIQKMVDFLDKKAIKYHGAYAHWLDGATGTTIPFSQYDDGGDLVETSYLMQGLLTAKEFFDAGTPEEEKIKTDITKLYNNVEWSWYQNGQSTLFWHWSSNYGWKMNFRISGWNEALITYILAAASPTYPIDIQTYQNGWAKNGSIKNNKTFYNYVLPLGPDLGGPLFFEQYTFLGVDPFGLKDQYADYELQVKNHSLINYEYCKQNPKNYLGYSENCWGLTASDTYDGYTAHEPNNDRGVITPTAALSSIAFTPKESLQALRFFYYQMGDKIWKDYGFVDAFSLDKNWYADSFLAIDQGPIIVMIENYRTKFIWSLFTKNNEVKNGMKKLGFTAPYL